MVDHTLPPRPRWNSVEVKTAAALGILEEVRLWALDRDVKDASGDPKQFKALLAFALTENTDAYYTTYYLHDIYDWPADNELTKIIQTAFARMPLLLTPFIHSWVMQNAVRLPAKKGDRIKFRVGTVEIVGVVVACIPREARMIVTVGTKKPTNMSVPVEEFITVLAHTNSTTPPTTKSTA